MKEIVTLTCDPSMRAWGWVVVSQNKKIKACGCIKTESENKARRIRKGDDTIRRLSDIAQELVKVIKKYQVTHIVSELPHGSQSASAAVMIGAVSGLLQGIVEALALSSEWYSEQDAKKSLFDKKTVSKEEMIGKIKELYPDLLFPGIKYKDEAIADSMAIYHAASKQSPILRLKR